MTAALLFMSSAPATAGCQDGEKLELTGTLTGMFPNQAGGWSLKVEHLNPEVISCDLSTLMGQKTASGPWFLLAVSGRKRPDCAVGSHISATLQVNEGFGEYFSKTASWSCQ